MSARTCSVIIPTLDAGAAFGRLLEALRSQHLPPHEVVVVDSGSTDDTVRLASGAGCQVVTVQRFDHAATRNLAVDHTTGDTLVFVTQDVMPTGDHWLESLVQGLGHHGVVAAYGRQIAGAEAALVERVSREFNYPPTSRVVTMSDVRRDGFKSLFFSDANSAVLRSAFVEVGGFEAPTVFGEDVGLAFRLLSAGHAIAYAADAGVWHTHASRPGQVLSRYFDIGVAHARHPEWLAVSQGPGRRGVGLAKACANLAMRERRYGELLDIAANLAARATGYALGRSHRALPNRVARFLSSNPRFWEP